MPKQHPRGRGGQPNRGGRPRQTPEQQAAAHERRIPKSGKGRLGFRPGDEHALDVQAREARNYRYLIAAKLSQLQTILSELTTEEDPSATISEQESDLKEFLWSTYREHKHRDHIIATFLSLRRARLLARLEAAGAALEVAADLLAPDDHLLQELRRAVEHQRQAAARVRPPMPPAAEGQEEQSHGAAILRVTGPDKEAVHAQLELFKAAQETEAPAIDARHIYGDVDAARQQLAAFDQQVKTMRNALSPAEGWFETYYIEQVRVSSEARRYIKRGERVPDDVPFFEGVLYGPYLKYRWAEVTRGPQYTIQMTLIPEVVPQDDAPLWPNL